MCYRSNACGCVMRNKNECRAKTRGSRELSFRILSTCEHGHPKAAIEPAAEAVEVPVPLRTDAAEIPHKAVAVRAAENRFWKDDDFGILRKVLPVLGFRVEVERTGVH